MVGVAPAFANQRSPSGPAAMTAGEAPAVRSNSWMFPAGSMCPIEGVVPASVNQRLPSGPGATSMGLSAVVRPLVNSLMVGVKALAGAANASSARAPIRQIRTGPTYAARGRSGLVEVLANRLEMSAAGVA